jgi:hypothetical protein
VDEPVVGAESAAAEAEPVVEAEAEPAADEETVAAIHSHNHLPAGCRESTSPRVNF